MHAVNDDQPLGGDLLNDILRRTWERTSADADFDESTIALLRGLADKKTLTHVTKLKNALRRPGGGS